LRLAFRLEGVKRVNTDRLALIPIDYLPDRPFLPKLNCYRCNPVLSYIWFRFSVWISAPGRVNSLGSDSAGRTYARYV